MASVVDICNLALSNLGHSKTITAVIPPDGSREATLCSIFYPVARDAALELHEWGFATRRRSLANLGTPPTGWDYRYALPSNCIRPLRVYETDGTTPQPFRVEADDSGTVILTDTESADLHYVARIEDPTKFTPSFVLSTAHVLAGFLAGPLTSDLKLGEYQRSMALAVIAAAETADANAIKAELTNQVNLRYPIGQPRRSSVLG